MRGRGETKINMGGGRVKSRGRDCSRKREERSYKHPRQAAI